MITVEGLQKHFGKLEVLKSISFGISPGSIVAIVGPNGSGKSTIIKCILGLVRPDAGTIRVDSRSIAGQSDYKSNIGYMPQTARFPENLTVGELLKMIRDLRSETTDPDMHLYESFKLSNEVDKALGNLSGGTRQKVSAHIAFMFRPRILILDEPTAGLDPISSSVLKDTIIRHKENGGTVIITSHILSELEELSDRVVFLLEGNIRFDGELDHLRRTTGENTLERSVASLMKEKTP